MKSFTTRVAAAALLATIASAAAAQSNTDSKSTTGSTTIQQPISLTKSTDLAFGTLVRPTSGTNTVTVGTSTCAAALSGAGNAYLVTGSTSGCATYSVAGESGLAFNIGGDTSFNMTRTGGTETITVTVLPSETSGTIGQSSAGFAVGGHFDVDSSTVAGVYSGTFNVTVTYQ